MTQEGLPVCSDSQSTVQPLPPILNIYFETTHTPSPVREAEGQFLPTGSRGWQLSLATPVPHSDPLSTPSPWKSPRFLGAGGWQELNVHPTSLQRLGLV